MENKKTISFVVAVYQNERAVTLTYEGIRALFAPDGPLAPYAYEFVFVNDGSHDGSLDELRVIAANDTNAKVLSFTRNFGQMAAMLAGFTHATGGDAVVNISADLQDPIEMIPDMVKKWEAGTEIVIAYREAREDHLSARLFSYIAYGAIRLSVPQVPKGGFDFVLIDRKPMDQFNAIDLRNRFFQGDLLWPGYSVAYLPYERRKRTIGVSQYNFWKKFKNFSDAILDASYLPIRFISATGVVIGLLGVLYSFSVILAWAFDITPFPGWAPLMIAVMVIGGLNLFMLGVVGEYIWRIYDEVKKRPNYIIREKLNDD